MNIASLSTEGPISASLQFHSGPAAKLDLAVVASVVDEALSELTRIRVEFVTKDRDLALFGLLGQSLTLRFGPKEEGLRSFMGFCTEAEFIGTWDNGGRYVVEARPRAWFSTRRADARVFQDKRTPEIIREVLAQNGAEQDLDQALNGSYAPRPYCIQYHESDFDFLSRLMEEEGIYYYFETEGEGCRMVLCDGPGSHKAQKGGSELEFTASEVVDSDYGSQIYEWSARDQVTTGRVSLSSYNFEVPGNDLRTARSQTGNRHAFSDTEIYRYDGRYREVAEGEARARSQMEAEAWSGKVWKGTGNAPWLQPGRSFTVKNLIGGSEAAGYLAIRVRHYIRRINTTRSDAVVTARSGASLDMSFMDSENYRCTFEAVSDTAPWRPLRRTPWPKIGGLQTAVVTGPAEEEIFTDEHGRVRIRFHWDRRPLKDETVSIWVRCMMPWTGKGFGAVFVPRVGSEVVVQFEDGDPDRPIVTGMLYNGSHQPPWPLPQNMTVSGLRTNSSRGGEGANELLFEDRKGAELVRLEAERDYVNIVGNNAAIMVGKEKASFGDLTQWVRRSSTAVSGLCAIEASGGARHLFAGGVINEVAGTAKATRIGFHRYEQIGEAVGELPSLSLAGSLRESTASVGTANPSGRSVPTTGAAMRKGEQSFPLLSAGNYDPLGAANVLNDSWKPDGSFESFAGQAAERLQADLEKRGIKPGRVTEIFGNDQATVSAGKGAPGDVSLTVNDGNLSRLIRTGNHRLLIETGDSETHLKRGKSELVTDLGNILLKAKSGDVQVTADVGSIALKATTSITLQVGTSKLEMSPMGVTITGPTITISSDTVSEIKALGMMVVKGGLVLIN